MTSSIWPLPKIDFLPWLELAETRPVALVTTTAAWEAVKPRLRLNVVWRVDVAEATLPYWKHIFDRSVNPPSAAEPPQVIYAVGGGLAGDAAKYLSALCDVPLTCLPTALSVDAFLTWASGHRVEGCVRYLETKPPDRLVIDFDVMVSASPSIRAAGICDVLSIATGLWDWKFAEEKGMNLLGMSYIPYVAQTAQAILQGVFDCAEAAGRGDPAGLKQLVDCLALEVQLCNQIGHSRPEEGSEHYFAYAVENALGKGLPHGDLVGPGIVLMAERQGQDIAPLKRALEACHISLNTIPSHVNEETLAGLADYARQHNLPFGIAHTL